VAVLELKIGVIGGGNMGEAVVGALTRSVVTDPSVVFVSDINRERLAGLQETYRVSVTHDSSHLFAACDVVILAVKPQQMGEVLSVISAELGRTTFDRKLVISIAAGIPLRRIEDALYAPLDDSAVARLPIIRVMPNTPALVLAGMSGMSSNRFAGEDDRAVAHTILSAMGRVIEFGEESMDAVTALSGSGPAYVFYLAESMIAAGTAIGLAADDASAMTMTTLKGALALLETRSTSAEQLRREVTSPGGTTEAAFRVLEDKGVKETIVEAIVAARDRGRELSNLS